MALWQSADTIKCPNCASNLIFSPQIDKLVCKYCGGVFVPQTLIPSGSLEIRDMGENSDDSNHEIVCNSCGAIVITDNETSVAKCNFCGSPAISMRRLSKEFKPDFIIPFKITKDKAESLFMEWVQDKKYSPKDFKTVKTAQNLKPIYVPFWLLDANCHSSFEASGHIHNDGPEAILFAVDRSLSFYMSKVPFDGSKKISDSLMEAIEPFDYSEMVEFNPGYLPGFFAQRYDLSAVDMLERIMRRFSKYGKQLSTRILSVEEHYNDIKITRDNSWAGEFKQSYALFPVWFMRYEYNDESYDVVINGQTGEVAGFAPVSEFKKKFAFFLKGVLPFYLAYIIAGLFVICSILGMTILHSRLLMYIGFPAVAALTSYRFVFYNKLAEKYNKARDEMYNIGALDKMPDVFEYYDSSKKVEFEKSSQKDQVIGVFNRENY